jgi:cobyrinic acid a,c-diamide synthase
LSGRGLIVAAAASHSGKTIVALGLIAALNARGLRVAAAKCGPDYIDPRFLAAATRSAAFNLDPWAMRAGAIERRLATLAAGSDVVLIEGVMGLYDGGPGGVGSTASLAAATGLPVVLVVGARGAAQSAAAVAEGCAKLAEGFCVAGAIVNEVASRRHAELIREGFCRSSVPLLGLVRRDPELALASRHLGLVQADEHAELARKIACAGELVADGCDLDRIVDAAGEINVLAPPSKGAVPRKEGCGGALQPLGQRIAVAADIAFAFAYPHLLQDWREQGAEMAFFSPLADEPPAADADAVFLPGGYPELHAARLAAAERFRAGIEAAAGGGALVYGECGGYMALGETLEDAAGVVHRMLGLLPLATSFGHRKLTLGYRTLSPLGGLPWRGPLAAHEFHYATILREGAGERPFFMRDIAGVELGEIGLRRGNIIGSFAHVIDTP